MKLKYSKIKKMFALLFEIIVIFIVMTSFSVKLSAKTENKKINTVSADNSITKVMSYGFVDLEGAKISAIIVEYNQDIRKESIEAEDYEITDYVIFEKKINGFDSTIERDGDGIKGNEGQITKVYVNNRPEISSTGGTDKGKYVIIEVNTDYMLSGQNLSYTTSMIAGVKQIGEVTGIKNIITAGTKEISNYNTEMEKREYKGKVVEKIVITADKDKIILPEFGENSGWKLNYIGKGAFKVTNAYSEYTGKYYDFELPYSIYVPDVEILEKNKGDISVVLHMEHAGANDTDPMAAITSSKAAVKLSGKKIQEKNPAIIIVPQIEETRRSTNDLFTSSEANTAVWELLDSVLEQYRGYINENRIYGTGQSMGGMTILNMASQRDNFFAGIAVTGAQWGNNYNKDFQNNGAAARSPENDPISFNGFGLDNGNYQNWYYMISDDNIFIHTTNDDTMSTGIWKALYDYFEAAGVKIPYKEWDPYLSIEEQNKIDRTLVSHENSKPGTGISWGSFTRGTHMSTWKYGYQIDYPFEWLFEQNRETESKRGKIKQLKKKWLGRDNNGKVKRNSGTAQFNSEQYTVRGASKMYVEGWTPISVVNNMTENIIQMTEISSENKSDIEEICKLYNLLSKEEKVKIKNYNKLTEMENRLK